MAVIACHLQMGLSKRVSVCQLIWSSSIQLTVQDTHFLLRQGEMKLYSLSSFLFVTLRKRPTIWETQLEELPGQLYLRIPLCELKRLTSKLAPLIHLSRLWSPPQPSCYCVDLGGWDVVTLDLQLQRQVWRHRCILELFDVPVWVKETRLAHAAGCGVTQMTMIWH